MSIDKQILQQLSPKVVEFKTDIEKIIYSIHRIPELRDWITLESMALPPIPVQRNLDWHLISLLTTPCQNKSNFKGWNSPWAAIEWNWENQQIVQKLDLRQQEHFKSLREVGEIPYQPADTNIQFEYQTQMQRQRTLFEVLEIFFKTDSISQSDYQSLASHYAGLLPKPLYPYYHILVPECQEWLRTDISAFKVTAISKISPPDNDIQVSLEDSSKLTNQLSTWLSQGQDLAETFSLDTIVQALEKLANRLKIPGFRLAVVGEFSRGKSSLINRILEYDLLPTGTLPTTATLTAITAGSQKQMVVNSGQGSHDVRPLEKSSWDDLLAIDESGNEQSVISKIRVTLDNSWLHTLNAELIDTPGAGDLNEQRTALVFDLLNQCDSAVLVVSATLPLSMSERIFLEEEVIGRHIPRICVVVSKLDTLDIKEREGVLKLIQERVSQISSDIAVMPAHAIDTNHADADALALIKEHLQKMVNQGDRQVWRSRQIAGQLGDWLDRMIDIGTETLKVVHLDHSERQELQKHAQAALQEAKLSWENLQLQLEQRRLAHEQYIRKMVLAFGQELKDILLHELHQIPEPKVWWERDFPFRLRRELLALTRRAEGQLLDEIAQDFEWLEQSISDTFKTQITQNAVKKMEYSNISPELESVELRDTRIYRVLTRIGSSAGMICGYVLGGPIGVAASTGIWLLGENIVTQEVKSQRQLLSQKLEDGLAKTLDRYCIEVCDRLRKIYQQLIEDLKQEQQNWLLTQQSILQNDNTPQETPDWRSLIDQATTLKQEIQVQADQMTS